jgi:hypothetical protein
MARKPNYSFERHERDKAKAAKLAEKRERKRAASDDAAPAAEIDGAAPTSPDRGEV